MAQTRPIVVQSRLEGQVDHIVHHKHESHSHHEESPLLVVAIEGRVDSQHQSPDDGQGDVDPVCGVVFEAGLELAEALFVANELHQHHLELPVRLGTDR
jgi:hypothetical protein